MSNPETGLHYQLGLVGGPAKGGLRAGENGKGAKQQMAEETSRLFSHSEHTNGRIPYKYYDEDGYFLFLDDFPFRRRWAVGQELIHDSKPYRVVSCEREVVVLREEIES